jgi:DNA-binding NtrC family response regulator
MVNKARIAGFAPPFGGAMMLPMMDARVLVVDDDVFTQQLFKSLLECQVSNLQVVGTLDEARKAFRLTDFNLVILDQRLPDGNGLDFFTEIHAERPRQMAMLITGYADVHDAVRAVREGLFDYLTKPFENLEELEAVIIKALEMDRAYREIKDLRTIFGEDSDQPVVGTSPKITQLLSKIRLAAPLDTTIVMYGESGSGKEVFAKLIHSLSERSKGPLVTVNCGALQESLLEAALFGYEKGAFTGAVKTTSGYLDRADGGTLFLDEITDMSPKLQVSLLRVLQERKFDRLGGTVHRTSDFRLICATNKSLEAEVKAGRFRPDLYYRINVMALNVPALRERREDVTPLALYFLSHFNKKFCKSAGPFTLGAIEAMEAAPWPGNIRQLRHAVERAVVINVGGLIGPVDLGLAGGTSAEAGEQGEGEVPLQFRQARDDFDRAYFSTLLKRAGGNMAEAARLSGIARQNLYAHVNKLGLDASKLGLEAGAQADAAPLSVHR